MAAFRIVTVAEVPYLCVARTTSMDPTEISAAMGSAFQEVWAFMKKHGVPPAGGALSVYETYSEDEMAFKAGFIIGRDDMGVAAGPVLAGMTPGGEVLHFTHRGSYATLRDDYDEMMRHIQAKGLTYASPTWEVYQNDPAEVHEEQLLTDCYQALAS